LTRNSERGDAPKITRAIQDRIGRELRDMYAELLRQPLPDNLIAPLHASAVPSPRDVVAGLRSESPAASDATLTASLPKAKSA
jgi:Anti-sigma factor NepR